MAIDLIWVGRQLLGDLFLTEKQAVDKAFEQRDKNAFFAHSDVLYEILSDLDILNSYHPHATLDNWLQQARNLGKSPQVKDYYEMNARRLITTWGGSLNDYACRCWNGLMWDYYAKRWENYLRELSVAVFSGNDFDEAHFRSNTDKFQEKWVTSTEEVICGSSDDDILTFSRHLRDKYRESLDQTP
jgi:alpha-N-acetylglucosaminidase